MKFFLVWVLLISNLHASEFVVEFNTVLTLKQKNTILSSPNISSIRPFTSYQDDYFNRLYLVNARNKSSVLKLKNIILVEDTFSASTYEIRPNPKTDMIYDDLLLPLQWGIYNQNQIIEKQRVGGGFNKFIGTSGVDIGSKSILTKIEGTLKRDPIVAVVDMGIDFDHPELKDNIFKNLAECDEQGRPYSEFIDRDGNGMPSDCHGWNFAATEQIYLPYPIDDNGHGTHISGIMSAKRNNGYGIAGVSDRIKILPIKVTGRVDQTSERFSILMKAPSQRIANGILYAANMNVDVINLSLGWPKSMDTKYMRKAVAAATNKGIIVVAAAGNDNTEATNYPCNYYDVICVGSVDANGSVSDFSNYGGQVDILAPGDQIVSTIPTNFIPLKQNIQGYDILSGTSQSAPFVSAIAALLKVSHPDYSADEIKRRVFDSAQKRTSIDKSLHGLINLETAFNLAPAVSIKPVFKENSQALVDANKNTTSLHFFLKNYGLADTEVKLKVESLNSGVEVLQFTNKIDKLKTGVPFRISVLAGIKSYHSSHTLPLKVSVSSLNMKEKVFYHTFSLGMNINTIPQRRLGFKFQNMPLPITKVSESGQVFDILNTVDSILPEEIPSYYISRTIKTVSENDAERGIKVVLFNYDGQGFIESKKQFFMKNAIKLLDITKGDFNFDNVPDLMIKTIVCSKNCDDSNSENDEGHVLYSFRDLELSPILGDYKDIQVGMDEVNLTSKSVRFSKRKLEDGTYIPIPYFVNTGNIPEKDFVIIPFKMNPNTHKRRIYFYEPELRNGIASFKTRTFMNNKFIDLIRQKMDSSIYQLISMDDTTLEVVQLRVQSTNDLENGIVKGILSFGVGFIRYNIQVSIVSEELVIEHLDFLSEALLGATHHDVINLSNRRIDDSFVSFVSDSQFTISFIRDDTESVLSYDLRDRNDRVMGLLGAYSDDLGNSVIVEKVDTISLIKNSVNEITESSVRIKKFSFLPGQMMSDILYPLTVFNPEDNINEPGIYIDSTQITGNQIFVSTEIDGQLVSPIKTSLSVPDHCFAKNPIKAIDGISHFVLVCREERGNQIRLIPITK